MRIRFSPLFLLALLSIAFVSIGSANAQDYEAKLKKIFIPKLSFNDLSLNEAIQFLAEQSKELDAQKVGVPIVIHPTDRAEIGDNKMTLSLSKVPLGEALRYTTSLAKAKYSVTKKGVVVYSLNSKVAPKPSTPPQSFKRSKIDFRGSRQAGTEKAQIQYLTSKAE